MRSSLTVLTTNRFSSSSLTVATSKASLLVSLRRPHAITARHASLLAATALFACSGRSITSRADYAADAPAFPSADICKPIDLAHLTATCSSREIQSQTECSQLCHAPCGCAELPLMATVNTAMCLAPCDFALSCPADAFCAYFPAIDRLFCTPRVVASPGNWSDCSGARQCRSGCSGRFITETKVIRSSDGGGIGCVEAVIERCHGKCAPGSPSVSCS